MKTGELETHFTKLAELLTSFFPRRDLRSNAMDYVRDEDAVRDQVRGFVARHPGDGGVLIFDETGDLKKGTATAGVGRQYIGTAGRIENAIVAVYAGYPTMQGHALIDRDLYVQAEWFTDPDRMRAAGFDADFRITTPGSVTMRADQAIGLVEPRDTTC